MIETIKDICQATVYVHRASALVVGDDKIVIVSKAGRWPVCINVNKIAKIAGNVDKKFSYLRSKLWQAGVFK